MTYDHKHPKSQPTPGNFPPTRWTIVVAAQGAPDERRRMALSELCESYWYPLYLFLRRQGSGPEDAEDLTQGFFAHLLSSDRFLLLSEEKGKLRTYLLKALKNFANSERTRASAQKRGGGEKPLSIDSHDAEGRYALEPAHFEDPEKLYACGWAHTLLDRSLSRLRAEYESGGRLEVFEALKNSLAWGGESEKSREEIAASLGISSGAVHVALHRLRKRYRLALEAEIADTVSQPSEIEEEVSFLHQIFARPD